ncbi:MAG TPA: 16S rRNA (cytosine(1402)-N(4))-methyltransferase RsmH [Myxococcales bacterium]|nr:16S rRNA (cytosine(1402)-N(4))-methyltransferase RsmH [Myxococcales bacterium]
MRFEHRTVLLHEAVQLLQPGPGKVIVDGTVGGGGHAAALLERGAQVIGLDKDARALEAAAERLAPFGARFRPVRADFADVREVLSSLDLERADGLLLDLGVSSPQLDAAERGFSFQRDGPLDMRMSGEGETAAERIRRLSERELADEIFRYGDERFSRPIARALKEDLPRTTLQAAESVKRAVPRKAWPRGIHVATRTFQALRIAVNGELESLGRALDALPGVLAPGGVAAVIAFHSLEDRMVKERFRALAGRCSCPPGLPVCACGARGDFALLTRKAVQASEAEVADNPRARSARLRAVERKR